MSDMRAITATTQSRGKHEREQVDRAEVVVDEDGKPDRTEARREDERAPVLRADTCDCPGLPDGERDDRAGDAPSRRRRCRVCTCRWRSGRGRRCPRTRRAAKPAISSVQPRAEPPAGHRQAADHDRDDAPGRRAGRRDWCAIASGDPPVASTIAPKASAAPAALIASAPIAASRSETDSASPAVRGADEQDDSGEGGEVEDEPAGIGQRTGTASDRRPRARSRSRTSPNAQQACPAAINSQPADGRRDGQRARRRSRGPPAWARAGTSSGRGRRRAPRPGSPTVSCDAEKAGQDDEQRPGRARRRGCRRVVRACASCSALALRFLRA